MIWGLIRRVAGWAQTAKMAWIFRLHGIEDVTRDIHGQPGDIPFAAQQGAFVRGDDMGDVDVQGAGDRQAHDLGLRDRRRRPSLAVPVRGRDARMQKKIGFPHLLLVALIT